MLRILSILCFQGVLMGQDHYNKTISVQALKEDVRILRKNLEDVHPGLYAYHTKEAFDDAFNALDMELNQPLTALGFYRKLLPILPMIANNHTKINCPLSYDRAMADTLPRFPFKLYYHEGRLFVHRDASDEQRIEPGSEIKSINGDTTEYILQKMMSNATTDGFNTSLPYFAISAVFSKYYGYYFGTPQTFEITFVNINGELEKVEIKGLTAKVLNKRRKNAIGYKMK